MAFSPLAMQRLQSLPSFQAWEAKIRASAEMEAAAKVEAAEAAARATEAAARAAEAAAAAAAATAEAAAVERSRRLARKEALTEALLTYFAARGEVPTPSALAEISNCTDQALIQSWLFRAYKGETAAQIFVVD